MPELIDAVGTIGLRNPDADNGLWPARMPLPLARNLFGGLVADAADQDASDNFFINTGPIALCSGYAEAAGATRDCSAYWELDLPQNYVAGEDITVTVKAHVSGGGTLGATHSLITTVWKPTEDGTSNVELVANNDTALAKGAVATYAATVPGATLAPGGSLLLNVEAFFNNASGGDLQTKVYAVIVS